MYFEQTSNIAEITVHFHYRKPSSQCKMSVIHNRKHSEHTNFLARRKTTKRRLQDNERKTSSHSHALHSSGCLKGKASPLSIAAMHTRPLLSLADCEEGDVDRWTSPSGLFNVADVCDHVRAMRKKHMTTEMNTSLDRNRASKVIYMCIPPIPSAIPTLGMKHTYLNLRR